MLLRVDKYFILIKSCILIIFLNLIGCKIDRKKKFIFKCNDKINKRIIIKNSSKEINSKNKDHCKTVFITGTNSGIGNSLVKVFAINGWNVAATVRSRKYLDIFSKYKNVKTYLMDVTDKDQIKNISKKIIKDFGKIDIIINNAGFLELGPMETTPIKNYENLYKVNVFGLINVTKAFLSHMRKNKSGTIVNISSDVQGFSFFTNYASSKLAVVGFSESLKCEVENFGIDVKIIFPGIHNSELFKKKSAIVGKNNKNYKHYIKYIEEFGKIFGAFKGRSIENAAIDIYKIATTPSSKYKFYVGWDIKSLITLRMILGEEKYFKILSKTTKGKNLIAKIISFFSKNKHKRFNL